MSKAIMLNGLGGGLPTMIKEIRCGEFTPETNITGNYTITYDEMQNLPEVVILWTTEGSGSQLVEQPPALFWSAFVRSSIYNPNRGDSTSILSKNKEWGGMSTTYGIIDKFGSVDIPNKTRATYRATENYPLYAGKKYKWVIIA